MVMYWCTLTLAVLTMTMMMTIGIIGRSMIAYAHIDMNVVSCMFACLEEVWKLVGGHIFSFNKFVVACES